MAFKRRARVLVLGRDEADWRPSRVVARGQQVPIVEWLDLREPRSEAGHGCPAQTDESSSMASRSDTSWQGDLQGADLLLCLDESSAAGAMALERPATCRIRRWQLPFERREPPIRTASSDATEVIAADLQGVRPDRVAGGDAGESMVQAFDATVDRLLMGMVGGMRLLARVDDGDARAMTPGSKLAPKPDERAVPK